MEDIPCIFCNTHRNLVVIEENGYTGKKCSQCALIYISPRPTRPEVLSFYEGNHAYVSAETHISGEISRRLYARHNLGIISRYAKAGTLLELGAGAGYFIDEARKKGFEVYGIELNSIQADFIRNVLAIPCEEHPLGESSFGGKSFDIIYHCDLLSHFYDPIAEFRMIHGKLSAGGLLVFETGNLGDVKERYYRVYTEFQYPDHLFFFWGEKPPRTARTGRI